MANLVTRIIISASDQASNVFDSIRANAGKLATAVAGYFGVKLFTASVDSAREFEAAMSRVAAASGATVEELAALKSAAEEAGASTQYTSVEAAAALENLAKAGLTATDAVATLPAVLDLATAGGVDLATSSDFISKAVAGMGLAFTDAGRVADVLAKGANASNTSVTGLAQALSYAAPLANSLGLSLEQTVAIIGKFADAGIDASRAGTALNSILAQFSDPASKFRQELASAGIITGDFDQALRQLAAAGPAGQKAILAVGQEAGPALRALLNQGIDSLDKLKSQLDDAAGSARTFAGVMSNNLDGASKGLGSAWEALKIKLSEPVLGPLKEQVDLLATGLREFVGNGTASRFGDAIASAFRAGAEWVRGFLATVDFDAVTARMQAFAAEAGTFFADFGQKAVNAGNIAKTAYGVMATGFNTVLAAVYKLGEGVSWMTSALLADIAKIMDGLDAITPDIVTEKFKGAAAALREESRAAAAVMEEFGKKSAASFDAATESANTAAEGWSALNAPIELAASAASAATAKIAESARQVGLTADEFDNLGDSAEVAGGKIVEVGTQAQQSAAVQSAAAASASQSVVALQAEYQRLIDMGDTQSAARVLTELQAQLDQTAEKAGVTADAVNAAFERLGVTSSAALKQAAEGALRDFEMIRDSGTASALDVERAFTAYAERAIEASGGVASATLRAHAATRGLRIEATESGSKIAKAMTVATEATNAVGKSADIAGKKYQQLSQQMEANQDLYQRWRAEVEQSQNTLTEQRSGGSASLLRLARKQGIQVDTDDVARFEDLASDEIARRKANLDYSKISGSQDYVDTINRLTNDALQAAANRVRAENKEDGGSGGRQYNVRIELPGSTTRTIATKSDEDAQELLAFLEELQRRTQP